MPSGPAWPIAVAIAVLIPIAFSLTLWAIMANLFDGGEDDSNKLLFVLVALLAIAVTTSLLNRLGMSLAGATASAMLGWIVGHATVVFLYFAAFWIACSQDDCLS